MFRTFTTAAVLALTISAAQAGDVVTVRFGDLNLADANDARILAGRVYTVAELRCAEQKPDRATQGLFYKMMYDACIEWASRTTSARVAAVAIESRRYASLH